MCFCYEYFQLTVVIQVYFSLYTMYLCLTTTRDAHLFTHDTGVCKKCTTVIVNGLNLTSQYFTISFTCIVLLSEDLSSNLKQLLLWIDKEKLCSIAKLVISPICPKQQTKRNLTHRDIFLVNVLPQLVPLIFLWEHLSLMWKIKLHDNFHISHLSLKWNNQLHKHTINRQLHFQFFSFNEDEEFQDYL